MKLFQSARLRLTFWYLIIIGFISISFSAVIYNYVTWELERGFIAAEYRLRNQPVPRQHVRILLSEELESAKKFVLYRLIMLNGIIIVVAGAGGYFLAGKTLKPIEDVLEEQKRFVADASHELRTPLTSMKSEIEVFLRDKKVSLKDMKSLLKSNLEEVNKMKEFSDYLLTLSRYEAGGIDLPFEKVELGEAVKQAIDRNLPQAKDKNIKIVKQITESTVRANAMSLVELASILINNAIKYSPEKTEVYVRVVKHKRSVVLEVKDEGYGINKKDIPHIFNRFYRADTSRCKSQTDGYGLGLSIAKSIADLHHADIEVKSRPSKGSTFTVVFPR